MILNNFIADEIFNRFGSITRARNCFLYTKKGIRLTDLYQQGGKAILGWGSSKATTLLKNVLNRGITGSFYTEFDSNLEKSVSKLLESKRKCFIDYSKQESLKTALTFSKTDTNFYKPWNPEKIEYKNIDCVILEPVLPWAQNIFIVAVKPEILEVALAHEIQVTQSDFIPAPLNAAISRSFYDLINELPNRTEKDWFIYDKILTKYWDRKGPYLFPKIPQEKYKEFILHCLNQNLVISPDFYTPSIIPFGADFGNFTKLKNNPFEF